MWQGQRDFKRSFFWLNSDQLDTVAFLVSNSQESLTGVDRHVPWPAAGQQELLNPLHLVCPPVHLEELNDAHPSAGDVHIQVVPFFNQNYLRSSIACFWGKVHLLKQLQLAKSGVDPINLEDILQLTHNHSNILVGMQSHMTRSVALLQFCGVAFQENSVVPPVVVDDVAAQVDHPDVRAKHHRLMRVWHRTSLGWVVQSLLVASQLPGCQVHTHNAPGTVAVVCSVGVPSMHWPPVHKKVRRTRTNSHPLLPGWKGGMVGSCLESPVSSLSQRLTAPPYLPGKRPGTNQETLEGKRKN